jgi:hypothetical protein
MFPYDYKLTVIALNQAFNCFKNYDINFDSVGEIIEQKDLTLRK